MEVTTLIEQFFEQGLLVGGLGTVCFVLWRSLSEQNKKVLQLIGETTKVIEKNTSSFNILEKLIEKQQQINVDREATNTNYWKARIDSQDSKIDELKNITIAIKTEMIKQKTI